VKAMRPRTGHGQADFTDSFGVMLGSVENRESGRCGPAGAARVLPTEIAKEPDAVDRALRAA